jgi:hypothetical protein
MNRRDFLKVGGLFSAVLLMQVSPLGSFVLRSVEVESQGRRYRGTSDGKILLSADNGKTWQLHTNFSRDFSILNLSKDSLGQVHALLEFAGYPFELALVQNSKTWRTV